MASSKKKKEALRAVALAYYAGAHHLTETVEKAQSLTPGGSGEEATEIRHAMLEADYARLRDASHLLEGFVTDLNENDLYPFGAEWPGEAVAMLIDRVIPPALSIVDADGGLRFRFRKGFKELLGDLGAGLESNVRRSSSLDHWMVLLINSAFHGGAVTAAQNAENPKLYYASMPELDEETEPWGRYPQLSELLDKQLQRETRRKTGLVTDLDY